MGSLGHMLQIKDWAFLFVLGIKVFFRFGGLRVLGICCWGVGHWLEAVAFQSERPINSSSPVFGIWKVRMGFFPEHLINHCVWFYIFNICFILDH